VFSQCEWREKTEELSMLQYSFMKSYAQTEANFRLEHRAGAATAGPMYGPFLGGGPVLSAVKIEQIK
jgi:hypothetical protein